MHRIVFLAPVALFLAGCSGPSAGHSATTATYFDSSGRDDMLSGGVKMIPVQTTRGVFHVWTKRVGNNPKIKVLLLHGGPGATHEYFEAFDSYFPKAGVEYYFYDQLGSAYSDQPDAPELWDLPRFVEEVEQVRKALKLDQSNFYLLGQSWGGILAMEYALKYQQNIKRFDHFQHGSKHPGLQPVRSQSAHARHGPEGPRGDQASRSRGPVR